MQKVKTSELLHKAADAIQSRGWEQGGGWNDESQGLCLEGGIAAAMGLTWEDNLSHAGEYHAFQTCPAYLAVGRYLHDEQYDARTYDPLFNWNDYSFRTEDEVIEVLRAAAEVEAAREAHADAERAATIAVHDAEVRAHL